MQLGHPYYLVEWLNNIANNSRLLLNEKGKII